MPASLLRPEHPSALGVPLARAPQARIATVFESEATYTTAGNAAFVTLDSLRSVAAVGERFAMKIRTHGRPLLIDVAMTMAHTSTGSVCNLLVYIDGQPITNDANGVANRGGEVGSGSGQIGFHAIVRLPAGLHTVTLYVRQSSGAGNTIFVLMNPRGGNPNDGYCKMAVHELPPGDWDSMPVAMTGIAAGNTSATARKPFPPRSAIIASAAESEGLCAQTSTTAWITWDSIRPAGITAPRMTRRVYSRGGAFFVCIHATFDSNTVGMIGYMDIAIDGNRIGDPTNGLDSRTQVASGNLTIAYFGQTKRLKPGWHTFELMLKTSGGAGWCQWNSMGASGGTVNDGWTYMVATEIATPAG